METETTATATTADEPNADQIAELLRPTTVDRTELRRLQGTLPPFPLPDVWPSSSTTQHGIRHHARIVDFFGGSDVPHQVARWLRAVGVEVQEFTRHDQVDGAACGFIAAEVVSFMQNDGGNINEIPEADLAQANTRAGVSAARRFLGLPPNSNKWINDEEIERLVSHRTSIDRPALQGMLSVERTTFLTRYLFARHSLELRDTGGVRYYILSTASTGKGFHWYVVAIQYAANASRNNKRRSLDKTANSADVALECTYICWIG